VITALDTSVLLDVLIPDAQFAAASKASLDAAYAAGALVVCEVVYAELATQFGSQDQLDQFLADTGITLSHSSPAALLHASEAWAKFRAARRVGYLTCPRCGAEQQVRCGACGRDVASRQHIVTDFLIGGHAVAHAHRLLTRDRGFYRKYFAALRVVSPVIPTGRPQVQ
jgi:predicted nucleic acid-binding protein